MSRRFAFKFCRALAQYATAGLGIRFETAVISASDFSERFWISFVMLATNSAETGAFGNTRLSTELKVFEIGLGVAEFSETNLAIGQLVIRRFNHQLVIYVAVNLFLVDADS